MQWRKKGINNTSFKYIPCSYYWENMYILTQIVNCYKQKSI